MRKFSKTLEAFNKGFINPSLNASRVFENFRIWGNPWGLNHVYIDHFQIS
jgi:hypothetical protein